MLTLNVMSFKKKKESFRLSIKVLISPPSTLFSILRLLWITGQCIQTPTTAKRTISVGYRPPALPLKLIGQNDKDKKKNPTQIGTPPLVPDPSGDSISMFDSTWRWQTVKGEDWLDSQPLADTLEGQCAHVAVTERLELRKGALRCTNTVCYCLSQWLQCLAVDC